MNCNDVRAHWSLYHDSEGDPELHWQVSEHLAECAACAEWFFKQSRLEGLIEQKLAEAPADESPAAEAMWDRVLVAAGIVEPVRPAARRRWFLFSTLAACAAAIWIAVATMWNSRPLDTHEGPANLSALSATLHERIATGATPVALASDSDLAVEDFLRTKVSFPVRCPPRKDSGFAVRGAGTCQLGSEPVAYVAGYVDRTPVSIFILSKDSLATFPRQHASVDAETIHRCREGDYEVAVAVVDRNLVVVVGRIPQKPLLRVLAAYGTYPDSHG